MHKVCLLCVLVLMLTGCGVVQGDYVPTEEPSVTIRTYSGNGNTPKVEEPKHDGEVKVKKSDIYVYHESDGVFSFARTDTPMSEVVIDGEEFNVTTMTVGDLYDIGYKNLYGEPNDTLIPKTEHYGDSYISLIEEDDVKESGVSTKICIYPYNPSDEAIPMKDCQV